MGKIDYFSNRGIDTNLAEKTIQGGVFTIVTQAVLLVLNLISLAILARFLTPEAFGIVAMVTAFTNLAGLFSDMGLSTATIQSKSINKNEISALFWLNLLIGILIVACLFLISDAIVYFYNEPRLKEIVILLSLGFLFSSLSIQHEALLRRHLLLVRVNVVHLLSTLFGVFVGVSLAMSGWDYWALVWMTISALFFRMLGMWLVCQWIPSLNANFRQAYGLFKFGLNVTGFNLINYFSRNLDKVLIGKFASSAALGEYSRVDQIALFPLRRLNGPITSSVQPALSRLQNEPDKYREYYRNSLKTISFIGTPIVLFLFLKANEVTLLILGPQWTSASLLLQCLMPAALCGVTNVSTGWVYNSLGHVNRQFKWGIYASTFLCISIIIGIYWGAVGVALAISISRVIQKIPGLLYCYQGTFLKLKDFSNAFLPSVYLSFASTTIVAVINSLYLCNIHMWLNLIISFLVFAMLYVLMIFFFFRAHFVSVLKLIKNYKLKS